MTSTYGPIRRFRDGNRYSLSSNQEAVSLPEGNNCKTTSIRGLSAVGEHLLGDYPTAGSNGLESRTTKSEFFWIKGGGGILREILSSQIRTKSGGACSIGTRKGVSGSGSPRDRNGVENGGRKDATFLRPPW